MLKEMLQKKMDSMPASPPESEHEQGIATLHLTSEHLPEVKDWEVGQEYHLVLKVKQTSADGGFEVLEAAPVDNKTGEEELGESSDEATTEENGGEENEY